MKQDKKVSTPSPQPAPAARRSSFLRTAVAICWGFFGVRKHSSYQEDIAKLTPLHIIAVGLTAFVIFIVLLIVLAKFVAGS